MILCDTEKIWIVTVDNWAVLYISITFKKCRVGGLGDQDYGGKLKSSINWRTSIYSTLMVEKCSLSPVNFALYC